MDYAFSPIIGSISQQTISLLADEKYFYSKCIDASRDSTLPPFQSQFFGGMAAFLENCALERGNGRSRRDTVCLPEWSTNVLTINEYLDQMIDNAHGFNIGHDRNLGLGCKGENCVVPTGLDGIWNYGCWCNFGHRLMDGKGVAVNKHDELCQRMQLCLRCAKIDGDQGGYDCNPKSQDFVAAFAFHDEDLVAACSRTNPGEPCARDTCTCQMNLVEGLVELIWDGYIYDPAPLHESEGGTFDFKEECRTKPGIIQDLDCCGQYPTRAPFHIGGVRKCCDATEKLYNFYEYNCCSDGVYEIGEPCN